MIKLLVALSVDGVMGLKNDKGMIFDSEVTNSFLQKNMEGEVLVMGNTTFKYLKSITHNNIIIVLSRTEEPGKRDGIIYYNKFTDILIDYPSFTVIGGHEMYHLFINVADIVIVAMLSIEIKDDNVLSFPTYALEEQFWVQQESQMIKDTEKISGLRINIIFTRWIRRVDQLH